MLYDVFTIYSIENVEKYFVQLKFTKQMQYEVKFKKIGNMV